MQAKRQSPEEASGETGAGPSAIVELQNVSFAYGGAYGSSAVETRVLNGIDLCINPGERMVLLGANGSGKSTLMRLIVGSTEPVAGRLLLDAASYSYSRKGRNRIRQSVQMVTQDPDEQIFATSVVADVSYGPMNLNLPEEEVRRRVDAALAAAEITNLAERVPHQLSFGQRKRVALAGALAMQPRVLLLDEPSAGLDPQATKQLLATLDRFHNMGTALLVATHDIDFAWAFAERAAVLTDGKLTIGSRDELMTSRRLLESARLEFPWAPAVSAAVGREVISPADLLS